MEGRSPVSLWGIDEKRLFLIIIPLALLIRVYNSFHIIISDEIFNLISIEGFVRGEGFNDYFFRHPPLYLLLSSYLSYSVGPYPQIPSFISIIFSVLSLIPVYYIAEHLFGRVVARWSCIFLAVMPANIYYSGWIKQDAMLLFFFTWSVFFFLKERYILAGISIGLGLLVKEFAIFFFPLSFLLTLSLNKDKGFRRWINWLMMSSISAMLSLWWYLLFGSTFYSLISEAVTGENIKEAFWHLPWWFYVKNIPFDLSYPVFLLALIGMIFMIRDIYCRESIKSHAVILLWILVFYLPLSLIKVKTPWYTFLATPPLAMVSALGFVSVVELLKMEAIKRLACLLTLLLLVLVLYGYDNNEFYKRFSENADTQSITDVQGKTWDEMLRKRDFWRNKFKDIKGKIGFLQFNLGLNYLAGLKDDKIAIIKVSRFMSLDREGILNIAREYSISVFIINKESLTYTEKNLADMTSLWGEPEKVGPLLVFKAG